MLNHSNALRDQSKILQDVYVMPSSKDPLRKSKTNKKHIKTLTKLPEFFVLFFQIGLALYF